MRPLKITMSAFGPYAGKVTLDMQKLGKSGIYLITGDTGAGKTTILMRFLMRFTARQAVITGKYYSSLKICKCRYTNLCRA